MVAGSEFCSCKERLSVMSFSMVPRWFYLGTLPLLLTLSSQYEYGVKATVTFAFNGFTGLPDVYTVQQDYQVWTYNTTTYSISLQSPQPFITSVAGRFLYPMPVQMTDPLNPTVVKSFSTTFIFQILTAGTPSGVGPGLAFIMVPDNITVGGNSDYMGLITAATTDINRNYASDDHTVGVELDTHMNAEFNDPNGNHVCIDVASMNSTENNTFTPNIPLTTGNPERLQQLWIDYNQADSSMTIYHAQYGQPKPVTAPLGSQVGVNMSIMKEYMYLGFSTAEDEYQSSNLHTIFAWSFSNEGEAPHITTGKDVGSPPHANPPPPPTPSTPPPNVSPPNGPVPAPVSPTPSVPPPRSPPPPIVISPPLRSPTPVASSPPPPGGPSPPSPSNTPPPPIYSPIPGPNTAPSRGSKSKTTKIAVGVVVPVVVIIAVIGFCLWWYRIVGWLSMRYWRSVSNTTLEKGNSQVQLPVFTPSVPARPKFHIFISHTAGKGGFKKNFSVRLSNELKTNPCYEVFIDRYDLPVGTPFPDEIMKEIRKIELGMGVGIMVVTEEFFEKHWPMIELVEFVKLQNANGSPRVRILPLFHELKPDDIRERLKTWEAGWAEMSTENHPVDVGNYRDAVKKLCNINGVNYKYNDWSYEAEYIQEILERVKEMYDKMHVVS